MSSPSRTQRSVSTGISFPTVSGLLAELDTVHQGLGLGKEGCLGCGVSNESAAGVRLPVDPDDFDLPEPNTGPVPYPGELSFPRFPIFTLAVNTVDFGTLEWAGSTADMVEDMDQLGAGIVRHPGLGQFFLGHILPTSEYWTIAPTAARGKLLPITVEQMDFETLYGLVEASEAASSLRSTAEQIRLQGTGLRLIITLFDLGTTARTPWGEGVFGTDGPMGLDASEDKPANEPYVNPLGVPWDRAHEGQTVWDDVAEANVPFTLKGTGTSWDLLTMDPRNPYKRMFFRNLARAIGRWIQDNAETLDLESIIAGVEICNEIAPMHTILNSSTDRQTPDGQGWGEFFYYCASALRKECSWLKIFLPGMAGYSSDPSDAKEAWGWDAQVDFLGAQLDRINTLAMLFGPDATDLVAGVDNHFYHWGERDALPLLYAWADLGIYRAMLDEKGFPNARLTMIETGVSVLCTASASGRPPDCDEQWPAFGASCPPFVPNYLGASASYRPPQYSAGWLGGRLWKMKVADQAPAYDFQAASVIMRLAAGATGGATWLGWHTFAAKHAGAFAGCGLREDLLQTDCLPQYLAQRPAYYAFRRFGSVLQTCTGATLLHPDTVDSAELFRRELVAARLGDEDWVWVVELENPSWPGDASPLPQTLTEAMGGVDTGWWAYLVFIDPGSPSPSVATPAACRVTLQSAGRGTDPTVYDVHLRPKAMISLSLLTDPVQYPFTGYLDGDAIELDPSEDSADGSFSYTVVAGLGQWPRLIFSTQRLSLPVSGGVETVPR